MKRLLSVIIFLCVSIVGAKTVKASDGIDFKFTADYVGKYIWRGQNLSDDPVFQAGVSVGYKGLTVAVWGNLDTSSINNNRGEFTEWDYSIDYSADMPRIEGVGYSVGLINYHFPSVVGDTTEFYWGLNFDLPLSPSVTVYHDIDEVEGTYVSVGVSHSVEKIGELGPDIPVGMEIGVSLGIGGAAYNDNYWGVDDDKLNDLAVNVSFPFEVGGWTLSPGLNYVTLVSDKIKKGDRFSSESDYFFAGISLSKSF